MVGRPDWREIRRLADDLSSATPLLRESLIKNDFNKGPLSPVKDQCEQICLALNKVLELPRKSIDGDMATTVSQAMDAAMDLKGQLATLINIANSLANNPSVRDRVELQKNWFKLGKKTISVSRSTAALLSALVEIIDLQAPGSEGGVHADTGS